MTLKRGLLQCLLAALLLVAQYTALTHGLRHWQPNVPAASLLRAATQSLLQDRSQDESGKQKSATGLCDFHVAFAEVLGAVGACALSVAVVAQAGERSIAPLSVAHTARLLAPQSRGPPVLL